MANNLRPTGIEVLGNIPWGTHFCQFYETKQDLLDIVVPYMKAGLEHNEFCLWVLSPPLTVTEALDALRQAVPDLDTHIAQGSLEVAAHDIRVLQGSHFNAHDAQNPWQVILQTWDQKLATALAKGFTGMRTSSNGSGFEQANWEDLMRFEKALNSVVSGMPIIALCAYSLHKANAAAILNYAHLHEGVIVKRKGKWDILEYPRTRELKAKLERMNEELEQRVAQRTAQLQAALEERKRAEELSNQIIDTFPGTFVLIDENYHILRWNKQFENARGYSPKEIKELHVIRDFSTEQHRKELVDVIREAFTKGSASAELTTHAKDGRQVVSFYKGRRIDYEGRPCIIASGIDITERRNIEAKFRNLVEQSIIGVYIIEDGKFTYVNPGLADIFGFTRQELINKKEVLQLIHPDDRDRVAENIRVRTAGKIDSIHYEMKALKKDGSEIQLEVYCKGCLHENPRAIMGIILDISERKKAEDELKMAYRRLNYHVDNTPLAVVEWDKDQCITRWSKRAEEIFGWTAAEMLGTGLHNRPLVYEEDIERVRKTNEELYRGADSNISENRNYTKDGRVIYCKWYNSALRDEQGEVVTTLSLVQDITQRKNAEAALQQSYEEIRRLSKHLQDIREEERAHIAREIHDELGQQLTVLKMDVSWLSKKLADAEAGVKEKLAELLGLLDGTVQSVRRISSELRPSLLDDLGLAAAMEWHLKEFEKRSGMKTRFAARPAELELPNEIKTALFRIFQESLTNVARHSGATEVKVLLRRANGELMLCVEDNGRGFDKEALDKIKTLGVLGMKERTLMLQGHYEIDSAPGKGTMVTVSVPLPGPANGRAGKRREKKTNGK